MRFIKHTLLLTASGLVLSSCGGGSSSSASSQITPPTVAESQFDIQTKAARENFEQRLADAHSEANTWLENNRREANIITTQSGLQYRVEKSSSHPDGIKYEGNEAVTVHYEGRLTNGTIFDSSFERGRPEQLKPSELIQGWQEALTLMQPGDEWTLFIPPSLGYGEIGKGRGVPANAVLIFEVQLR